MIAGHAFDLDAMRALFPDIAFGGGERGQASARFRDFRERLMAVDQTAYLESLLMRQDKMAMSMSVEARVPFTHMPLARSVARIPLALRVPGGTTKPILKAVARKFLPTSVVDRRKVGLTLPFAEWLRDPEIGGQYLELLTEPNARLTSFAARQPLRAAVETFRRAEAASRASLVPHLVNLELWLRSLEWDEAPGRSLQQKHPPVPA